MECHTGGSMDPKMVLWVNGVCGGAGCAGDIFLGTREGGFVLFSPHVCLLKMLRILWRNQKWAQPHGGLWLLEA